MRPPFPDTFLRKVAPQVKSAELIAEDKARQDCIGNISSCFQKACKDTIDPNDQECKKIPPIGGIVLELGFTTRFHWIRPSFAIFVPK